jgi:RNA polymerase sigma-70 factor, ECF subfamily
MSAAITHERNDVANIRSLFIGSEEGALLESAVTGDSSAFESLVMPHRNALLRVTQRILRNREDAEDAVQHALLDAFRNLNGFQGRSRFSSWLTRIAVNAALMRLRASRRERALSLDEVFETSPAQVQMHLVEARPNPEEEYLLKEDRVLLQKGLKKLSPLYIEVMYLRSMQELSAKEAAGLLEVPLGTVKARLHRARTKLTQHVRSIASSKRRRANVKPAPEQNRPMRRYGSIPSSRRLASTLLA